MIITAKRVIVAAKRPPPPARPARPRCDRLSSLSTFFVCPTKCLFSLRVTEWPCRDLLFDGMPGNGAGLPVPKTDEWPKITEWLVDERSAFLRFKLLRYILHERSQAKVLRYYSHVIRIKRAALPMYKVYQYNVQVAFIQSVIDPKRH